MAQIKFKAKIETLYREDDTISCDRIKVPSLNRQHCDMHAFRKHPEYGGYANSDLFPAMLSRIRTKIFGGDFIELHKIPDGVSVDTSKFLAVVTVEV